MEGRLAASEALVPHTLCVLPAAEVVGAWSRQTVAVALETGHTPFVTDQMNELRPGCRLPAVVVAERVVESVAVPAVRSQAPVPTDGTLPVMVAVTAHTV
jgi:hypothetical protein